jgi:hypothetical protein
MTRAVSGERWLHTAHHLLPSEYWVTKREKEAPVREASLFCRTFDARYTAIFSERDVREPGASNGITRPWLDAICASLRRIALDIKLFAATAEASK